MPRAGVLVLAFGGPRELHEVGAFMADLMGREPSPELVEQVRRRYLAIGGRSPLPDIASGVTSALAERLAELGHDVPVELGMRYAEPRIPDALAALVAGGVDHVVTVSLSPFESKVSSGAYRRAVEEAAVSHPGLTVLEAEPYHLAPGFIAMYVDAYEDARERMREFLTERVGTGSGRILTLFTAHSLPEEDLDEDPYIRQLHDVTSAIVADAGLDAPAEDAEVPFMSGERVFGAPGAAIRWFLAYQSKGRKPGTWLGPDVDDVVRAAAEAGFDGVVVCPVGFVTDHMETLYDLDIVAAGTAYDADMEFTRAKVPNDAPGMIGVLAEAVTPRL